MIPTKEQIEFLIDCCEADFRTAHRGPLQEPYDTWLREANMLNIDPDDHYMSTLDGIQESWEMALFLGIVYGLDIDQLKAFLEAKFAIVGVDRDGEFKVFVGENNEEPEYITVIEGINKLIGSVNDTFTDVLFSDECDVIAFVDGHATEIDIAVVVSPAKEKKELAPVQAQEEKKE
jgi:hypothetical protein